MLSLPAVIAVQLTLPNAAGISLHDILVAFDFQWHGHYYYGAWVGLTDASGMAQTTRESVGQAFAENRALFPMDYKVPLEECDSRVRVLVTGNQDYVDRRRMAESSRLVTREALGVYTRARNALFRSTSATVDLADSPLNRIYTEILLVPVASEQ
ncbi:MAG TPA: hypothetical protein VNW46_10055 [Gemmatimonadaceae bacterium]|jgi:hypothetical protein|nr:hypothetical protein [Gemmatimonadaceae bacterium]